MYTKILAASALVAALIIPARAVHADALAVTCAGVSGNAGITWTATPAGGVTPYTYLWTSGATSAAQSIGVTPGTYSQTVTVTDASSTAASATCTATKFPSAPVIATFTAAPTAITAGGSSVLAWTTTNASSTSLNQGLGNVTGTSITVHPTTTTTYTLSATNPGGTTTSNVTVTVNPPTVTSAPTISHFTATPAVITVGGSTVLSWSVANASTTSINNGVGSISSTSVTVNPSVTTTYTLTATNPTGSTVGSVTVTVNPVNTGTGLAAQIQALLNQINALKAQIAQLMVGQIGGGTGTGTTTPPVITPGACNPMGRDIARGAYGDDVKDLQKFLAKHPNLYPEGIVNGFYGPHTMQAVKRWQKENGLPQTGFFGRLSRDIWKNRCTSSNATTSASSVIPTIGNDSSVNINLADLLKLKFDDKNKNKGNGRNDN